MQQLWHVLPHFTATSFTVIAHHHSAVRAPKALMLLWVNVIINRVPLLSALFQTAGLILARGVPRQTGRCWKDRWVRHWRNTRLRLCLLYLSWASGQHYQSLRNAPGKLQCLCSLQTGSEVQAFWELNTQRHKVCFPDNVREQSTVCEVTIPLHWQHLRSTHIFSESYLSVTEEDVHARNLNYFYSPPKRGMLLCHI